MNSYEELPFKATGLSLVFIATAVAGALGYLITVLLARLLGQDYGQFAIFWSALYLVIGSLAGLQQETARASSIGFQPKKSSTFSLVIIAFAIAFGLFFVILLTSPLWEEQLFGASYGIYLLPFSVGAGLWVLVSFLMGALYGSHQWRLVALTLVLDVALRAGLVLIFPFLGWNKLALPWMVILPFALMLVIVWTLSSRKLTSNFTIDVPTKQLLLNFSKTLIAALSMSFIVSGFPLILGATTKSISSSTLSAIIFAVILTRAPLVMVAMSLQSYFIIFFRDRRKPSIGVVSKIFLIVVSAALVFGVFAFWLANPIIIFLAGSNFSLSPEFLALLTVSSASTALLALTGSAVLASSRHTIYSLGWLTGAAATLGIMVLPLEVEAKTVLALSIGPILGIFIHLMGLFISHE